MTTFGSRLLLVVGCLTLALPAMAQEPGKATSGLSIFQQNCAVCHGNGGKGDGPAASGFNPRPANFSERTSSEERQRLVVTNGGASQNLSPVMPPFGEMLSEQQIRDVVAYVRENLAVNKASLPTASK
jgi:mono/diheme cytochrome c family protein